MTDKEKQELRESGFSEEDIEAVIIINEQMKEFLNAINKAAKPKDDLIGNDLIILS